MMIEVTSRTIQGRFLLAPSPLLNRLIVGVLARAQRRYDVQIHAFCFMSNHYHLLVSVDSAFQLARFMNFVQSNIAREAGRLTKWRERFWGRRYQAILVSDEPEAQLGRLRYVLAQGCKEGLVARPEHWRGAQCVRQLLSGEKQVQGQWIDRTALYLASQGSASVDAARFSSDEHVTLTPLPCLRPLSAEAQCDWIAQCIEEIAIEARQRDLQRSIADRRDMKGVTSHPPPHSQKRSPAPWFHVASANAGRELRVGYLLFAALYRSAAAKLRRGLDAVFPDGCFPPPRPFVELASTH
jgi:REP element-mobilizing transposase RayT